MARVLSRRSIRVPLTMFAAVLAAGCAAPGAAPLAAGRSPAPPPSVAAGRPVPTCPATGLRASAGPIDAAMGLRAMSVALVNCGRRAVTLEGYPGARLTDEDGVRLKVAVKHGVRAVAMIEAWEGPPRRVTLRAGEVAVSLLVWRNTTEDLPNGPATATALEVAVSDGRPYQAVPLPGVIDLGTTATLAVSPWRPDPAARRPAPAGTSGASRASTEPPFEIMAGIRG
jgi:hypothetical protein